MLYDFIEHFLFYIKQNDEKKTSRELSLLLIVFLKQVYQPKLL